MRLFLLDIIKCPKCNSTKYHKPEIDELSSLEEPIKESEVDLIKKKLSKENFKDFIFMLVDSLSEFQSDIEISESDVYEFFEEDQS